MTETPPEPMPDIICGVAIIKAALTDMPMKPGVYQMMNQHGDMLYVGKAKNLRNRVTSYATARHATMRIMRMIDQVAAIQITVTQTEAEALLLEANLIKKWRPRYNILLRDDKSFPYVLIEGSHDFPKIAKHRGAQNKPGDYFGPFASVGALNQALAVLQKAFLLRPCSDSMFTNRSRPCLQYQIKRCSAPCVGYISKTDYAAAVTQATQFLRGKNREVQDQFAVQMQQYSEQMEYEKAAAIRDRIRALTQIQQEQNIRTAGLDNADVIALVRESGASGVLVLFFRSGHHFGSQSYFPSHGDEATDAEIMAAFIGQFYQIHTPPPEIIVNHEPEETALLAEALGLRIERRVEITLPKRGDKRQLLEQAAINAQAQLSRHLNQRMSEQKQRDALAKLFAMSHSPTRIEVYDNSHIMGQYALGAMIVAGPDGFDKKSYRRFTIKDLDTQPGDDYAMMREMFRRRFARLQKDDPTRAQGLWPDLVLIDGGAGQLSAVSKIFADLGIEDLCYVAIAKGPDRNAGRETFFMPNGEPFTLPPNDPALHYLQRLRDEAHRFAIGSHRIKRAKSISQSDLDDIPGIGATRKRALLHHFGSKSAVEKASLSELEKITGINKKTARIIYDYFHHDS